MKKAPGSKFEMWCSSVFGFLARRGEEGEEKKERGGEQKRLTGHMPRRPICMLTERFLLLNLIRLRVGGSMGFGMGGREYEEGE